jgi:polyisoprenoid-binding protein YceI
MRRLNTLFSFAFLLAPLALSGTASAQSKTFKIDSAGGSSMQFVSDAPLEKFTGKSTSLSGTIDVDPAKADKGKAEIKAEVGTIKTCGTSTWRVRTGSTPRSTRTPSS